MKQFVIWLLILLVLFGGLSMFYHSYLNQNPRYILFAIDTSASMQSEWFKVLEYLKQYEGTRYTSFCVITTHQGAVQDWRMRLDVPGINNIKVYGPRRVENFLDSSRFPQLKKAQEVYVFTNADDTSFVPKGGKYQVVDL